MGKENGKFRKATFGGFNRKDVIDYIEKIKNESFEYKKQVEETVNSLNEKMRELENAARFVNNGITENTSGIISQRYAKENFSDIGQATRELKAVADELCRSLGDFVDLLNSKGLFEKQESCSSEPSLSLQSVVMQDEESVTDSILSSISYLGASSDNHNSCNTDAAQSGITDILAGYSFVK